ncbi:hypothetical protein LA10_08479 [Thermotoga neapolitana LA10]|uniref:Transporter n=1 Tax=Thermotoga maritima (strain ATCC 43589 / DSM 3109 / JCM 10099 / NBRC 100826 / MSB8) TaxID=243274 RepID=Q9X072_THEMA|nr:hypothetical protein TM_0977 [Thermotoga maritima MSB8]AJG41650.1 hypothetical protein TRQ7_09420 [Thermotoga sp. RQ7]KFZ21381.1 hypothetical protein LA10_08479 [Thermotoga neapolitana LA10]
MRVLHLDRGFERTLITLMVLPPPFIMPLFISERNQKDMQLVLNTLYLHVLVTFVIFTLLFPILFNF